jgi:hypothetical protein
MVLLAPKININGILDLQSNNPTNLGSLDMVSNTLSLTALAVTSGVGDVTGIVKDHMLCNQPSVYFWEC